MVSRNEAIDLVLDKEKGYVNHPEDPGGETNWGITRRTYPHLDIANLSRSQAFAIYARDFWSRRYYGIESQTVANLLLLHAVNAGTSEAVKTLQRAANKLIRSRLAVDGKFGPLTTAGVNLPGEGQMWRALLMEQGRWYFRLAKRQGMSHPFIEGWITHRLMGSV